jgi:hypothetical protein
VVDGGVARIVPVRGPLGRGRRVVEALRERGDVTSSTDEIMALRTWIAHTVCAHTVCAPIVCAPTVCAPTVCAHTVCAHTVSARRRRGR